MTWLRRLLTAAALTLVVCLPATARERFFGYCINEVTGAHVAGCTVTVFDSGTADLSTIFSDNAGSILANPFTADLTTGFFDFYGDDARYDVRQSGTVPTTFTWGDVLLDDSEQMVTSIVATASGATPAFDVGNASIVTFTLTQNVTSSTITNGVTGQVIRIYLAQDGTGGFTFVWPVDVQLRKGGYIVADDANAVSTIVLWFDGTNWREHGRDADEFGYDQIPVATGQNIGSATARPDAFLEAVTIFLSAVPDTTGRDLGSSSALFDAFLRGGLLATNIRIVGGDDFPATLAGIQAAHDDLTTGASPGGVIVPAGTYSGAGPLTLDESNAFLVGAGRNNTIIECTNVAIDCVKVTGDKERVRGIDIRYSAAADAGTHALRITNSSEGHYDDIFIVDSDVRNGILVETDTNATTSAEENHFNRVSIINCANDGFTVTGFGSGTQRVIGTHLSDVRVAACTTSGLVVNDWVQGLFVDSSSRFELSGRNVFINPTATGRTFDLFFDEVILDNAQVNENLWADNVDRLFVDDSWIATTPAGKFNVLFGSGVAGASRIKGSFVSFGLGGEISAACDNCYLTNNTYHSAGVAPTDAINVTAASSGAHISGGEFRGGYTNDITDNGTNTVIGPFYTDNHTGASVLGPKLIVNQDTNYFIGLSGANPLYNFDANDFIVYDRASDKWNFDIGGSIVASLTASEWRFQRLRAVNGTSLVAGDFALSAGWGTTASIGTITGNDQWFQATITSTGTGQGASPTVTLTFQDGTWTNAPIGICQRADRANQTTIEFTWTTTATTLVLTFEGTPVAAETFVIACHVGGV